MMLRMTNVSRHRPQDTLEWFYKEWHGAHVDIMRSAPGVMRLIRRYVQNPALREPSLPEPPLPLGVEGWDAMSQTTFETVDSFKDTFEDPDYINRIRSHAFSDPSTVVSLLTSQSILIEGGVPSNGVKACMFYKPKHGVTTEDLLSALDKVLLPAVRDSANVIRYARNMPSVDINPAVFQGSCWEGVPLNTYSLYEELYFDDCHQLGAFLRNESVASALTELKSKYLASDSFTFLCREIVQIHQLELPSPSNLQEQNKAISRKFFKALDLHDRDAMVQIYHEEFSLQYPGLEKPLNREEHWAMAQNYAAAFGDMKHTPELQIAERDLVVTQGTITGTNDGTFNGQPPTGRQVNIKFINIMTFRDAKLIHISSLLDVSALQKQIGHEDVLYNDNKSA